MCGGSWWGAGLPVNSGLGIVKTFPGPSNLPATPSRGVVDLSKHPLHGTLHPLALRVLQV